MRKNVERIISSLISCALIIALFSSCSSNTVNDIARPDEVLTMQAPDSSKITITIRAEYNVNNSKISEALSAQFPEVNFIPVFHCSPETQYELRQSLSGNSAEDIIISPNMKAISDIAADYLMDLSTCDFVNSYSDQSLESCQVDGRIYYLPGPSSIYGIVYDKTMFNENGWQIPHSYDEFIKLVNTINSTGIRAIQPTCKYARQAQLVFTMFDYDDTFGGIENAQWLSDFQNGRSSFKGHMDSALKRYSDLAANGIISSDDFDMQPGNRSNMLYTKHTCAMIIENEQAELYAKQADSDHEYGMIPFWCGNTDNSDKLMSIPGYYIAVNKSLSEKGNEKKLEIVKDALRYISTAEGQKAISGESSSQISNVKDTSYTENSFNSEIINTIKKGNLVSEVDFLPSGNNNAVEKELKNDLREYLSGNMSSETLEDSCDTVRNNSLNSEIDRGELIGTSAENLTSLQTGLFISDALKNFSGSDIGLCLVGTIHCGTVGRIYKGDIFASDINSLSLSIGVTSGDPNDKKLWTVSMTGSELTELLKSAYSYDPADNVPNIPYYVASGLKIRFAPWKNEKLVSVTLSDGSQLESDKSYTVALWGWPFDFDCPGEITKVYDDSCDEILTQAVQSSDTINAFSDDRFVLDYSVD
jgi:ABC-type glycerol-3-phosphate transport system substrate-binding protein